MNIFVLDRNPIVAASYYADKHVIKIILEARSMLDMAHGRNKNAYYHNKVSKWVRECIGNYEWTATHAAALCRQYTKRYYRQHAFENSILELEANPPDIPNGELKDFCLAVPDDCKTKDPVESYRKYYLKYKTHLLKYKNGNIPEWVRDSL